jgi:hypothetical protein
VLGEATTSTNVALVELLQLAGEGVQLGEVYVQTTCVAGSGSGAIAPGSLPSAERNVIFCRVNVFVGGENSASRCPVSQRDRNCRPSRHQPPDR